MKQRLCHFSNKVARKVYKAADVWAKGYWHNFPFGDAPKASKEKYLELWEEAKAQQYPDIDAFEKSRGIAIDKDWLHDLALHTQIVVKESKLCYQHGPVLYTALREYLGGVKAKWDKDNTPSGARMITIIETGTARGFSSVVMARAMSDEDVCGKIMTFDLLPHNVKMYWNCIDDHEGVKTRQEILAPWKDLVDLYIMFMENDSRVGMRRAAMGRVNFAFLDGAHTFDDVMIEFDLVQSRQEAGDVIVFDDYNETLFPGVIKGVDEGAKKWGYDIEVLGSRDDRAYVIATKQG